MNDAPMNDTITSSAQELREWRDRLVRLPVRDRLQLLWAIVRSLLGGRKSSSARLTPPPSAILAGQNQAPTPWLPETQTQTWEDWFEDVDRLDLSQAKPLDSALAPLLEKYRKQGLNL